MLTHTKRAPAVADALLFAHDAASAMPGRARSILVRRTEQRTDQRNVASARVMTITPRRRLVAIDLDGPAFDHRVVGHAIADARLAMPSARRAAPLLDDDAPVLVGLAVTLRLLLVLARRRTGGLRRDAWQRRRGLRRSRRGRRRRVGARRPLRLARD